MMRGALGKGSAGGVDAFRREGRSEEGKSKGRGPGGDLGRGSEVVTEEKGRGRGAAEGGPETVNNI